MPRKFTPIESDILKIKKLLRELETMANNGYDRSVASAAEDIAAIANVLAKTALYATQQHNDEKGILR